jgi:hypothetical protein
MRYCWMMINICFTDLFLIFIFCNFICMRVRGYEIFIYGGFANLVM